MTFPVPANEAERLAELHALAILDTAPEQLYDDVVTLAAAICGTPTAIINFVDADRQWGKALVGMEDSEAPRSVSFCARTIVTDDGTFVVEDARNDPDWADNPMVTGGDVGFYAGASIQTAAGNRVGTVCVADPNARTIGPAELEALRVLARQTAAHLELRDHTRRLAEMTGELRRQALEDGLTGLPNRALLHDRLNHALARRRRTGRGVGLLFCDLDGFKTINDTEGHDAGDAVLRLVARRLTGAARTTDTVARLAGDEFVVVCPEVDDEHALDIVRTRLRDAVLAPTDEVATLPGISIGAVLATDACDADGILRRADVEMYAAKRRAGAAR